jgi:hypothetical protein
MRFYAVCARPRRLNNSINKESRTIMPELKQTTEEQLAALTDRVQRLEADNVKVKHNLLKLETMWQMFEALARKLGQMR